MTATQHSTRTVHPSETEVRGLLQRIAKQDESALRELHQAYAKRIYAFALNRLHDEQDAETVVVDALYEVWQRPDRFRGESLFSTWILGIAKFKVLMMLRARRPEMQTLDDEISDTVPDESMGVFETVLNTQHRHHIDGCLETLPDAQRECLTLTFYEGWSVADIAEFQSCPEGTAKTRLFHARKNIKDCLEQAFSAKPSLQVVGGTQTQTNPQTLRGAHHG
jgi:RNA polymerase sigma-70 factor, ECF subfamily